MDQSQAGDVVGVGLDLGQQLGEPAASRRPPRDIIERAFDQAHLKSDTDSGMSWREYGSVLAATVEALNDDNADHP